MVAATCDANLVAAVNQLIGIVAELLTQRVQGQRLEWTMCSPPQPLFFNVPQKEVSTQTAPEAPVDPLVAADPWLSRGKLRPDHPRQCASTGPVVDRWNRYVPTSVWQKGQQQARKQKFAKIENAQRVLTTAGQGKRLHATWTPVCANPDAQSSAEAKIVSAVSEAEFREHRKETATLTIQRWARERFSQAEDGEPDRSPSGLPPEEAGTTSAQQAPSKKVKKPKKNGKKKTIDKDAALLDRAVAKAEQEAADFLDEQKVAAEVAQAVVDRLDFRPEGLPLSVQVLDVAHEVGFCSVCGKVPPPLAFAATAAGDKSYMSCLGPNCVPGEVKDALVKAFSECPSARLRQLKLERGADDATVQKPIPP